MVVRPIRNLLVGWLVLLAAGTSGWAAEASVAAALDSISSDELRQHVDVLADDTFEGREAGSRGGLAAAGYLRKQFARLGLAGGGEDGGYRQPFSSRYYNLLVLLPGSDPKLKHEYVVVGGHYDHVGYGTASNSYGPTGYIHNGADDNASGTAALLEVLDAFTHLPATPRRSILFAFWDAEEKGLLGSKHWVAHPTVPLDNVTAMINVDMVGRLRKQRLLVYGSRSGMGLRQLVSRSNEDPELLLDFTWELKANSDHWSFFSHGIPALMLHTGLHSNYHRPSDDADKVNPEGMRQVTRLLFRATYALAETDQIPTYRSVARRENVLAQRKLEQALVSAPPRLGVARATRSRARNHP